MKKKNHKFYILIKTQYRIRTNKIKKEMNLYKKINILVKILSKVQSKPAK